MLSIQLGCCHWLINLIRVRSRDNRRGERERWGIEEESRIGRLWSLCWLAPEIGSINLHKASHKCNKTNPTKQETAAAFLCAEDSRVESPACLLIGHTCVCETAHECWWIVCFLRVYFISQKHVGAIITLHIGLVPAKYHWALSLVSQNNGL